MGWLILVYDGECVMMTVKIFAIVVVVVVVVVAAAVMTVITVVEAVIASRREFPAKLRGI